MNRREGSFMMLVEAVRPHFRWCISHRFSFFGLLAAVITRLPITESVISMNQDFSPGSGFEVIAANLDESKVALLLAFVTI
jgi:hypothetical protein